MKIIISPDSFKESFSAIEVANSIGKGILKIMPNADIKKIPISDGGEGLLDALVEVLGGKRIKTPVKDPLQRNIQAEYGILDNGKTAVIEMATASGLELLQENEKNPMTTSTFGTGQLIKDALDRGCTNIIIGIGGSATNDGGTGMITALGGKFLDNKNKEIAQGGGTLNQLHNIDLTHLDARLKQCNFIVACDVSNPLTGKNGASFTYGAQKGGTKKQLELLDNNLKHYAIVIQKHFNKDIDNLAGSGAAGGMGAGLVTFFNAELKSGIDLILETLNVEKQIKNADLVFTGEGKIDNQTLQGKTISGISKLAKKHKVPVIAITGKVGEGIDAIYKTGITSIFSIVNEPMPLQAALKNVDFLIQSCTENIMRTVQINSKTKL